jgi:hypothetical protein
LIQFVGLHTIQALRADGARQFGTPTSLAFSPRMT